MEQSILKNVNIVVKWGIIKITNIYHTSRFFIIKYRKNRKSYNKAQIIQIESNSVVTALQEVLRRFPNCQIIEVREKIIDSHFKVSVVNLNLEE